MSSWRRCLRSGPRAVERRTAAGRRSCCAGARGRRPTATWSTSRARAAESRSTASSPKEGTQHDHGHEGPHHEGRALMRALVIADSGRAMADLTRLLLELKNVELRHASGRADVSALVSGFAPDLVLVDEM